MADLMQLKKRFETVRVTEDSKDKIIEDLLCYVERLQKDLQQEENEYQDQKKLVGAYREEVKKFKSELKEKSRKEAMLKFASVLIDGDHMNFLDEFIQRGHGGGRSAAKALMEAVRNHVRQVEPDVDAKIQYKIRVYANVIGLAKTYRDTGIVSSEDVLESFIQGFNMENPLCDFVDAGNGKECSDVKIRALFDHCFLDVHCQHIVFCGSADNGYARVLGPHRGSKRISLVESPPFAHELKELVADFETTSFPGVFRLKKLSRRVSFGGTIATPAITPPRTPTANYASMARAAPTVPGDPSRPANSPVRTLVNRTSGLVMCRNANGERVDSPLHYSTKGKLEVLKQHKFCNQFHVSAEDLDADYATPPKLAA
ncbi:CCCH zinc finger DNA binding protein [Penicillium sp. IBT 16267x]|nr:CCCH zinc finger DNA binding protein [Penicillium sp. IBT 16267x]